jgi:hypothetical protein
VLIWSRVADLGITSSRPPGERTAASTESGVGRMVKIASAPAAASFALAAARRPRAASRVT